MKCLGKSEETRRGEVGSRKQGCLQGAWVPESEPLLGSRGVGGQLLLGCVQTLAGPPGPAGDILEKRMWLFKTVLKMELYPSAGLLTGERILYYSYEE